MADNDFLSGTNKIGEVEMLEQNMEKEPFNFLHLLLTFFLANVILITRRLCIRFIIEPIVAQYGIKSDPAVAHRNAKLEKVYASRKLDAKIIAQLSKELNCSKKVIKDWLKFRITQKEIPDINYFCQGSWKVLFAMFSFAYGLQAFWEKPWLWSVKECYNDFHLHVVTDEMWWYYMFTIGNYFSKILLHLYNRHSDRLVEYFFHDLVVFVYLHFAWFENLMRLGILVILAMGFADSVSELMKMVQFVTHRIYRDLLYILLAVLWMFIRIYMFPIYIVYSSIAAASQTIHITDLIIIMNSLLIIIVGLDGCWAYFFLSRRL